MKRGDRVGGRFEIIAVAGSGGMGTVFRARDVATRGDVAIKIVAPAGPDDAARFLREAEILSRFADPGVVGYVAHGTGFLAMEWVEGETRAHRLDPAPLSIRDTLGLARQLARALAALHDAGIIHRDVKPANLMLSQTWIATKAMTEATIDLRLVDFGIARRAAGPSVTRSGARVGSAGYMAPEQARGDRDLTGAADVFAFGCVLYECLAGVPAFCGDSAMALRAKALLHDPTPLRLVAPELPVALDELVTAMLAREPSRRPAANALTVALREIDDTGGAAPLHARRAAAATTVATSPASTTCAIIVAGTPAEVAHVAPGAQPFPGGAVTTRPDAASAAQLGLALAAQLPAALIAIACGATPGDAIDRSAQIVEQLEIAATTGAPVAGVWIHGGVARELGARYAYATGARAGLTRLVGEA